MHEHLLRLRIFNTFRAKVVSSSIGKKFTLKDPSVLDSL